MAYTLCPAGVARGTKHTRVGAAMELHKDNGRIAEAMRSTKAPIICQARWSYTPGLTRLVKLGGKQER